jgi:hypothetical protein
MLGLAFDSAKKTMPVVHALTLVMFLTLRFLVAAFPRCVCLAFTHDRRRHGG